MNNNQDNNYQPPETSPKINTEKTNSHNIIMFTFKKMLTFFSSQSVISITVSTVALFGALFNTYYTNKTTQDINTKNLETNKNISELEKRFQQSFQFNEALIKLLPNFVETDQKSRLAFISLYEIAKEPEQKCTLLNIALSNINDKITSKETTMMISAINLVYELKDLEHIDQNKNPSKNCSSARDKARLIMQKIDENSKKEQLIELKGTDNHESINSASSQLLAKLTDNEIQGWIFLGIKNDEGKLEQPTIELNDSCKSLPKKGDKCLIKTEVYLREKSYNKEQGLGRIIGVISPGDTIEIIDDLNILKNNSDITIVWANIKLIKANKTNGN